MILITGSTGQFGKAGVDSTVFTALCSFILHNQWEIPDGLPVTSKYREPCEKPTFGGKPYSC